MGAQGERPSGIVAFLFSDVEGSTGLWEHHAEAMADALATHDEIIRGEVERHRGYVFSTAGDSFAVAFHTASDAVAAAIAIHTQVERCDAAGDVHLRVRIGIHVGEAVERGGDYFGPTLNRAARISDAGHGGQLLVSDAVVAATPDLQVLHLGDHRLKGVSEPIAIHQVLAEGLAHDFPRIRSLDAPRINLPVPASAMIGRGSEQDQIIAALRRNRLVTITGPGGAGKTTLAVSAAREHAIACDESAHLVDLTPAVGFEDVVRAVARAVGSTAERPAQLAEGLGASPLLLVVDNCEHVVDPVAEVIEELMVASSVLRVLATSREPLEVPSERVVRIPMLTLDDAIELFTDRAAPGAADDLKRVAELCERLDRLPLALELAASRTQAMSVRELEGHLDDRFRTLDRRRRRARGGQRTLEETVAWSYDLLDVDEQHALQSVSTLAGPFDLELGASVLGTSTSDALDLIESLVVRSLVERRTSDSGGRTLYYLLETIRAFAAERLMSSGRDMEVKTRWARAVAHQVARDPRGIISPRSVVRMGDVAAAERFVATHSDDKTLEDLLRVTRAQYEYFEGRFGEVHSLLRPLLDEPIPVEVRVQALAILAWTVGAQGDLTGARTLVDEAVALDPRQPLALWGLLPFAIALDGLDDEQARRDLDLFDRAADLDGIESFADVLRAALATWRDDPEEAIVHGSRAWTRANAYSVAAKANARDLTLLGYARSARPERVLAWLDRPGVLEVPPAYRSTGEGFAFQIEALVAASIAVGAAGAEERSRRLLSDALAHSDERRPFPGRNDCVIALGCAATLHRIGRTADARALCRSLDVPGPGIGPGIVHIIADVEEVADSDRPVWVRSEPFRRVLENTDELRAERRRLIEQAAVQLELRG